MSTAELLPSMREATISNTEKFGPKVGNHLTAAEVAARAAEEAAQNAPATATAHGPYTEVLPSMREATIANTEKFGPKVGSNRPSEGGAGGGAAPTPAAVVADTPIKSAGATPAAAAAPTAVAAKAAPTAVATKATPAAAAAKATPTAVAAKAAPKAVATKATPAAAAAVASNNAPMTSLTTKVAMGVFAVGAAALTVFSIYKGVEMYNRYRLRRCVAELEQLQPETVHLYIFRRSPLAPSISVPCTRLETFLRVSGIPYEAHVVSDPSISPNKRLPFVAFGGESIADTAEIINRLSAAYGIDIDAQLTREDRATGTALLAALSYSLTKGYLRSVHVDAPDLIRPYYSEMNQTPDWLTKLALSRMRNEVMKTITTTGYSKLTVEQYQQELFDDIKAIEGLLLNGTEFLFSNATPSTYDCALYAWLLPIVAMEEASDVNEAFEYAVQSEAITAYVKRMTDLAFPDLDELVNEALRCNSRSRSVVNAEEEVAAIENVAAADAEEAANAEAAGLEVHVANARAIDEAEAEVAPERELQPEPEPMDIPMVDSPKTQEPDVIAEIDMDQDEL